MVFLSTMFRRYHLNISEDKSTVELYKGSDLNIYAELSHTQNKPDNDFFSIQDVISGGHKIGKDSINILGAVKQVGLIIMILIILY